MPVRGNRGLVGSPERPPSTLDPPQVSSSILSSPCWFKSHARPPGPPALLLVPHQLTSPAGAASRDLLLVCSGSTHQFGLARRGHVDSKVPLFALCFSIRWSNTRAVSSPPGRQLSTVRSGRSGGQQSVCGSSHPLPSLMTFPKTPSSSSLPCAEGWAILLNKLLIANISAFFKSSANYRYRKNTFGD